MFRRIITIDGDRFLMQMMNREQYRYAIQVIANDHPNYFLTQLSHNACLKRDEADGAQWIMSSSGKQLLHYAVTGKMTHTRGVVDYLDKPFSLWVSLVPVDAEGHPYRLDQKDLPDGTFTYGGSIHVSSKKWTMPHTCKDNEPFPVIGDTGNDTIPWVAYNGYLLSRLPIYICSPTMLEEEFERIAKQKKAEVERDAEKTYQN